MKKRFVVGLTGGLASGKSLALAAFRSAGAATVSLDAVSRDLCRPGSPVLARVARAFGTGVLGPDGGLDRARLGERVFADQAQRRKLEAILHPAIRAELKRRLEKARGIVVVEVPLLFEAGRRSLAKSFDATVLVSAKTGTRLARARASGMAPAQAKARMAAQLPDADKARLADVTVRNDGSVKDFVRKIAEYHKAFELIQRSRSRP